MSHGKKGTRILSKMNRAKIILCLRMHGPLSRSQISKFTGIGPTCVGDTCNELLAENALVAAGTVAGPRGRPLVLLSINPDGAPVVGVRIAPEATYVTIASQSAEVLARRIVSYDSIGQDVESVLDAIVSAIRRSAEAAGKDFRRLAGVGVSVHDIVDPTLGIIEEMAHLPGWQGVPIVKMLEERLRIPVVADNCVRAAALAHQWFDFDRRLGSVLYVVLTEGIGGALMYGQDAIQGIHHSGARMGHTVIDRNGPPCACGSHGCLETLASDIAYIRRLWPEAAKPPREMSPVEREGLVRRAIEMAREGDRRAKDAYESVVSNLAIGIGNAVTLFGPRTVIIAGTIVDQSAGSVIDDIRHEMMGDLMTCHKGVEIRGIFNCQEFLTRGSTGLILCQPYRELRRDSLAVGGWGSESERQFAL